MDIRIGCDPEFFLKNRETGAYVSAHMFVPGSKYEPVPVDCGAVQVDGTAVEFNIVPAAHVDDFCHNIDTVLTSLRKIVPEQYEFAFEPYIEYDKQYFKTSIPRENKRLGCDPDFDAWNMGEIHAAHAPRGSSGRCAGGHVHIGYTDVSDPMEPAHFQNCIKMAQFFDWTADQISKVDYDERRERMYGKPGMFRPKIYGVECRRLSGAWVKYPALWSSVYDAAYSTYSAFASGVDRPNYITEIPSNYASKVWRS